MKKPIARRWSRDESQLLTSFVFYRLSLGMSLFRKRVFSRTFWEGHIPKRG